MPRLLSAQSTISMFLMCSPRRRPDERKFIRGHRGLTVRMVEAVVVGPLVGEDWSLPQLQTSGPARRQTHGWSR